MADAAEPDGPPTLQAGIARCVVTPDPLIPISRGMGDCRPAKERIGQLEVRVLVLQQGDLRVALASMPFIGWSTPLCARVRRQVKGIPPENILFAATHTHSAPDTYGFPNAHGGYAIDLGYLEATCQKTAQTIQSALDSLEPVHLRVATGEAFGKIAYNAYAPDFYDPRCGVLQCLRPDGTVLATVINYACHPEMLAALQVCSPDLIGPLYDYVDAQTGGTTLFVNSAQGGLVTADDRGIDTDEERWSECVRIGELLGSEALRIVAGAPVQTNPALWCAAHDITFSVCASMAAMMRTLHPGVMQEFSIPPVATTYTVQQNVINLGNAQCITIPGEALPNIGYYLKRKMHGEHNFLLGLTNDGLGYFLSKVDYDSFKSYDYITLTSLHEMAGEELIEASLALVEAAPRPQPLVP